MERPMEIPPAGRPVYVRGSGAFLPGAPIPFDRIESVLGELTGAPPSIQAWIKRTGPVMQQLLAIKYLHYAIDPHTRAFTDDSITMAVNAALPALAAAGMAAADIELLCYGSPHMDQMPTPSVRIQEALGIERCAELAIHANCTAAYKALFLAHRLIANGCYRTALVASANMASSELRAEYYNQPLVDKESLFLRWFLCDGAGAVVLSADPPASGPALVLEQTYIESIGGSKPSMMFNHRPAYWMNPMDEFNTARHHLRQQFRNSLATGLFQEEGGSIFFHGLERMLKQSGIAAGSIRYFQVNLPTRHIAESVSAECAMLGISPSALYTRLDELGYSGPPMVFICLDRILREERLARGDRIASFVTEVSKFMQAGYVIRYDERN
jgi:3-oxoacyl-[acyl-carrier-protein] synthase-3